MHMCMDMHMYSARVWGQPDIASVAEARAYVGYPELHVYPGSRFTLWGPLLGEATW